MHTSTNLHNVTGATTRIVHHYDSGDSWLHLTFSTEDGGSLTLTLFPQAGTQCTPERLLEQLAPVGVQA
jgi:hypothetical protein